MQTVNISRSQVHVAILLIFLLGFAAGALSLNLYHATSAANVEDYTRLERLSRRLDLSGEQRAQVRQVLSDAGAQLQEIRRESQPKVAQVRRQTRERLEAVLSNEQWERFQKLMMDAREHRERVPKRRPLERKQ